MRFAFNVVFYGLVEFIHWPARDRKLYLLARWMLMGLSFSSFAPNEPALLFEWFLICTKRTRKQSLQLIMSCGVVVVRETGAIACLLLFRLNWIFLGFFFFYYRNPIEFWYPSAALSVYTRILLVSITMETVFMKSEWTIFHLLYQFLFILASTLCEWMYLCKQKSN